MPHILLRFMAIEDEKKLKLSRRVASVWVVISMVVAIFIGIVGYSVSKLGAIDVLQGSASETIVVKLAHLLSTYGIPAALLAGVVLAGILASTMSTADSQLLAAASSMSQNLMSECLHVQMNDKKKVVAARVTVVLIAVVGMFMAKNPDSSVFGIVSFAWAGFGSAFGPVVVASLYWRRLNAPGAAAGIIVGAVVSFAWGMSSLTDTIYEIVPGVAASAIAMIVVTLLTKKPDDHIVAEFNHAVEESLKPAAPKGSAVKAEA